MTASEWAGLAVALMTIAVGFTGAIKWLVKHYLAELKPNGGGSVKDQVNRLEERIDQIYLLLCEKDQRTSSICFSIWNFIVCNANGTSSRWITSNRI